MARDDMTCARPPAALDEPGVSLVGKVDAAMVEKLRDGLAAAEPEGDLAIELTTSGGDAELGRRMALDVERAARRRRGRLLFLGKTEIYSAGVTVMAAFPREHRFLTDDAVMLIHCRKLEQVVTLSGPIRTSLPLLDGLRQQIELGLALERQIFERLVASSDISLEELSGRALCDWYLTADEALRRGLVARVV